MIEKEFYVIAFDSTHYALKTEKLLKPYFKIEMIPTPREISASCGLSIKFSPSIFDEIMKTLEQDDYTYKVFRMERLDGGRRAIKVS